MSDQLSADQIAELRTQLQQLREELEGLLQTTADGARPVDLGTPIGRLSRMDALQQQSMAQASRRGHAARLQQVVAALAAIGRGDYGLCRSCEEPIGYARLRARPEAPLCRDCQQQREPRR